MERGIYKLWHELLELFSYSFFQDLFTATVRISVPLTFAAVGGLLAERSGVFNIGLEGMMLTGAFMAVLGANITGSTVIALLAAIVGAGVMALIHAVITVSLGADQIVSGIAMNIACQGITSFAFRVIFGMTGGIAVATTIPVWNVPLLEKIPLLGRAVFQQDLLVYGMFFMIAITTVFLFRSRWGLALRSSGEYPAAADSAGLSVKKIRYLAVLASGMLAGLGGAYLSLVHISAFSDNMTSGRGFIALAALIFGRWHPVGVHCFLPLQMPFN